MTTASKHLWRLLAVLISLLLAGCISQPKGRPNPDAQDCLKQIECTLKFSRTLLFVFAYAEAGAPLVESDGKWLQTPVDAPLNDWPAVYIRRAAPMAGRFEFRSECRKSSCRFTESEMLSCYRNYLDGQTCSLF